MFNGFKCIAILVLANEKKNKNIHIDLYYFIKGSIDKNKYFK